MARKKKISTKPEVIAQPEIKKQVPLLFKAWSFKLMALLVFGFAVAIYANSIFNEYALDDGIVITENAFTKNGFSGIPEIFSHESFSTIPGVNAQLSGGRYRPLSVVSFAMEYQFFGARPSISHLVNVLLYGLVCVLLFYFLGRYVFKDNLPAALIAALIYAVHPLHTDVVSNIKGRDEILSLLLLLACLISYLKFVADKKYTFLFGSLIAYFLSLLAKENGITFIAVIPLTVYFFMNKKPKEALASIFPFLLVFAGYLILRLSITGLPEGEKQEVMNAPFLLAQADQEIATKIMILGKDLLMLFFPHPLSYDYSFNQIPYVHFSDWKCLLSLAANAILVFFAFKYLSRKHLFSYAVLFYFITLSIVTNFVFEVGSPFNERFLFQPSIGFAIAIALLINYIGTLKPGNIFNRFFAILLFGILIVAGSIKTIIRNADWKNNDTLFAADAIHAPNSAKTNNFAAIAILKKAESVKDTALKNKYFEQAIPGFKKALKIYPDFADAYINLGNIYAQLGRLELSKESLMKAKAIYPSNNVLNNNLQYLGQRYQAEAERAFANKDVDAAIRAGNSSIESYPQNVSMLYNLGGYYLTKQNPQMAKELWTKALALDPSNATIKYWLDKISTAPAPNN